MHLPPPNPGTGFLVLRARRPRFMAPGRRAAHAAGYSVRGHEKPCPPAGLPVPFITGLIYCNTNRPWDRLKTTAAASAGRKLAVLLLFLFLFPSSCATAVRPTRAVLLAHGVGHLATDLGSATLEKTLDRYESGRSDQTVSGRSFASLGRTPAPGAEMDRCRSHDPPYWRPVLVSTTSYLGIISEAVK
ncbi:hypothetical protein BDY21DRAFT_57884 [Lineolata rhizophorae]|uniref:Uncharacterized protein n=1 Tax=Lineolata rhizophorae TaxID=578093 RepID=A0A6A6NWU6_9PEZI|nr:hypothetical protein BDY21DRAFT_57884 [Lineolata rhizophorae]